MVTFVAVWLVSAAAVAVAGAEMASSSSSVPHPTVIKPFMGVDELVKPAMDGHRASLNVTRHFEGGRRLHLSYDVEHPDDAFILKLDEVAGLQAVDCGDQDLRLAFESPEDSVELLESLRTFGADRLVITGSHHWGCVKRKIALQRKKQKEGEAQPAQPHFATPNGVILRKAGAEDYSVSKDGLQLIFQTQDAHYLDVFKHATIRFMTSAFPQDSFHQHNVRSETSMKGETDAQLSTRRSLLSRRESAAEDSTTEQRRRLGFFKKTWHSVTKAVVKGVSHVAKGVEKVAKDVGTLAKDVKDVAEDAIKLAATGDLDVDDTKTLASLGWNYENGGAKEYSTTIATDVTCKGCYANAELDLIFELDVHSYSLKTFKLAAQGEVDSSMTAEFDASYTYEFHYNKTVAHLTMDPITIVVFGVPLTIDISAPVVVGVDATIQAEAKITASGSATGSVEYGVQYKDDHVSWINDKSFKANGGLSNLNMQATGSMTVWADIVPAINIEHIGGPEFSLKPRIDITAIGTLSVDVMKLLGVEDAESGYTPDESNPCQNGVSVSLGWGFEAALGAEIDIHIVGMKLYSYSSPQRTIYSISKPITSGCFNLRRQLQDEEDVFDFDVVPTVYETVEAGDLYYGRVMTAGMEFRPKCLDMYGGNPATYLEMHMRIAAVDRESGQNGEDVFTVISTLNYADKGSNTSDPFACVEQKMFTWTKLPDSWGTMIAPEDQEGVNVSTCSNSKDPHLEYVCMTVGNYITCSDVSSCVSVDMFKDLDDDTTSLTKNEPSKQISSKCYYLTESRDCIQTAGCNWCVSDQISNVDVTSIAAGCVQGPSPAKNLPWPLPNGDTLLNCNGGVSS